MDSESAERSLKWMNELCREFPGDLYLDMGTSGHSYVEFLLTGSDLCHHLMGLRPNPGQILESNTSDFVTRTLPISVEIILRKRNRVEHEHFIAKYLISVARLLALPFTQVIPELCELRVFLFAKDLPRDLKFIPQKVFASNSTYMVNTKGFFGDFGHPNIYINKHLSLKFWPDDSETYYHGVYAIGHYIRLFYEQDWYRGIVLDFLPSSLEHVVEIFNESKNVCDNSPKRINLLLSSLPHQWIDAAFENQIRQCSSCVSAPILKQHYSASDIGLVVRQWDPKKRKYSYGAVIDFHMEIQKFIVLFENGDISTVSIKMVEVSPVPKDVLDFFKSLLVFYREKRSISRDMIPKSDIDYWVTYFSAVSTQFEENFPASDATQYDDKKAKEFVCFCILKVGKWISAQISNRRYSVYNISEINPSTVSHEFCRPPVSVMEKSMSHYFFDLWNVFLAENGFVNMCDSFVNCVEFHNCKTLSLLVLNFYQIFDHLGSTLQREIAWELKERVPHCLSSFCNTQLKDFDEPIFAGIIFHISDSIISYLTAETVIAFQKCIDNLKIIVAVNLIRCSQIQKRLLGVSMIASLIQNIAPRNSIVGDKSYSFFNATFPQRKPRSFAVKNISAKVALSDKELVNYILNSEVIIEILVKNPHRELIRYLDCIIIFLISCHHFSDDQFSQLWNIAIKSQESIQIEIMDMILYLSLNISPKRRLSWFNIISSVSSIYYSVPIMNLVKDFTISIIRLQDLDSYGNNDIQKERVANQDQWLGFGVLWRFIQSFDDIEIDSVAKKNILMESSVNLLVELLCEEYVFQREFVMHECIRNIRNGHLILFSMMLLRRILSTYVASAKGSQYSNIREQIDNLNVQHRLLDVLLLDIERFCRSTLDWNNLTEDLVCAAGSCFSERLELLKLIFMKSNLSLSEEQCLMLWKNLCFNSTSDDIREKFVGWFTDLILAQDPVFRKWIESFGLELDPLDTSSKSSLYFISHQDSEKIQGIDSRAWNMDIIMKNIFLFHLIPWATSIGNITSISRSRISCCILRIFLYVNWRIGAIQINESDTSMPWYRVSGLLGWTILWRMAMDSLNNGTSNCAAVLLIELQHRLPSKSKEFCNTIHSYFLKTLFLQLSLCTQAIRSDDEITQTDLLIRDVDSAELSVLNCTKKKISDTPIDVIAPEGDVWFDDGAVARPTKQMISQRIFSLIRILGNYMYRFRYPQVSRILVKVSVGKNSELDFVVESLSTNTLGDLKRRINLIFRDAGDAFFLSREKSNVIGKILNNVSHEVLDKLELTLQQAGIVNGDVIVVRKPDSSSTQRSISTSTENIENKDSQILAENIISQSELDEINIPKPFLWLHKGPPFSRLRYPPFPLGILQFSKGENNINRNLILRPSKISEDDDVASVVSSIFRDFDTIFSPYIDQLIEILDGYFSDLDDNSSSPLIVASWNLLQIMPYQSVDLLFLSNKDNILSQYLSMSNPFRFLYSLCIIDHALNWDAIEMSLFSALFSANSYEPRIDYNSLRDLIYLIVQGGLEKIVSSLQLLLKDNVLLKKLPDTVANELHAALISTICRIISKVIVFDPVFCSWKVEMKYRALSLSSLSSFFHDDVNDSFFFPSGVVTSLVDIPFICSGLLGYVSQILLDERMPLETLGSTVTHSMELCLILIQVDPGSSLSVLQTDIFDKVLRECLLSNCESVSEFIACRIFDCLASLYLNMLVKYDSISRENEVDDLSNKNNFLEDGNCLELRSFTAIMKILFTIGHYRTSSENMSRFYTLIALILSFFYAPTLSLPLIKNFADTLTLQSFVEDVYSYICRMCDVCSIESIKNLILMKLNDYRSTEMFFSSFSDPVLLGILRIVYILLYKSNDGFNIEFLDKIYQFLFPESLTSKNFDMQFTACYSNESRILAYEIIRHSIASNSFFLFHIVELMTKMGYNQAKGSKAEKLLLWNYDPSLISRRMNDKYVGLKNQGGTCYMNSFLQQLCRLSQFSSSLLSIDEYNYESGSSLETENVFFQLQVLFGYLLLSPKRFVDTLPFCRSIRDFDGSLLNLAEQKDVYEFSSLLFDNLEKNQKCKQLLNSELHGTLVWKTTSLETDYRSEMEEGFYIVSAEVKGKSSLEESLDSFVTKELFTGDNKIEDSDAGRKVDGMRQCLFRKLPPILIVHLKRFEFDLMTLSRKKVNDCLSFPSILDMGPYTEEVSKHRESIGTATKAEDEEYKYELHGIICHVGAIDRGHYYSFIKDDISGEWNEFNDRNVFAYDEKRIPWDCFGGEEKGVDVAGNNVFHFRQFNAYMLFYQKVGRNICSVKDAANSHTNISKAILSLIYSENADFTLDKYLFSLNHYRFMWTLLQRAQCPQVVLMSSSSLSSSNDQEAMDNVNQMANACLLALKFCVEVIARGKNYLCFELFINKICEIIDSDQSCTIPLVIIKELCFAQGNTQTLATSFVDYRHRFLRSLHKGSTINPSNDELHRQDKDYLKGRCHEWLILMFVLCPHGQFVRGFEKVMMLCCRKARNVWKNEYLTVQSTDPSDSKPLIGSQNGVNDSVFDVFQCPLTTLVNRSLIILDRIDINDVAQKPGLSILITFFVNLASLGNEERHIFISLRAIYRIICAMLIILPASGQIIDGAIVSMIDFVSALIRSSPRQLDDFSSLPWSTFLLQQDVQAFLNRVFLDSAIQNCSILVSSAISHLVTEQLVSESEIMRLLDFLREKIEDFLSYPTGTHLKYRDYLRVAVDLLQVNHSTRLLVTNSILVKLMPKIRGICLRRGENDAEFLYAFFKAVFRVGISSSNEHHIVSQMVRVCREMRVHFTKSKRNSAASNSSPSSNSSSLIHPTMSTSSSNMLMKASSFLFSSTSSSSKELRNLGASNVNSGGSPSLASSSSATALFMSNNGSSTSQTNTSSSAHHSSSIFHSSKKPTIPTSPPSPLI